MTSEHLLICADLHLNDNSRDDYRHEFVESELPYLIKHHRVDTLAILGDLTERKDEHGSWLVNQIANHFRHLTKLCDVIAMLGNHDYTDPDHPFFQFLRFMDGVTYVSKPRRIGPDLYLPHTSNYKRDWKGLDFTTPRYIFAHNTFAGAVSEHGQTLEGIPTTVFPNTARVWSGDVHVPQTVGPVKYVGAPYTVDFGDKFEPRVVLFERDEDGITSGMWSIKTNTPRKVLLELEAGPQLAMVKDIREGDILKMRVHLPMQDFAKWAELRAEIKAWGKKHGYVIDSVQPIVEYSKGPAPQVREARTDEELTRDYSKYRDLDKAMTDFGVRVVKEAP